jgi:hypothetical protein
MILASTLNGAFTCWGGGAMKEISLLPISPYFKMWHMQRINCLYLVFCEEAVQKQDSSMSSPPPPKNWIYFKPYFNINQIQINLNAVISWLYESITIPTPVLYMYIHVQSQYVSSHFPSLIDTPVFLRPLC